MRYVVAVSGGVDSVVLLDILAEKHAREDIIVAHFDHGIRTDSATDAAFVKELAAIYGHKFETKREELGRDASEELARNRRYAFLREVARRHGARIVTAHHADDIVETIAINTKRGTGWRGLAVLDRTDVARPLLAIRKRQLLAYAKKHGLEWREDSTNSDTKYLRNAVRQQLGAMNDDDRRLVRLYRERQVALKELIDTEAASIIGMAPYGRYFFTNIPDTVAVELLRAAFLQSVGESPVIPQRQRVLNAIKTFAPGKRFAVTNHVDVVLTKSTFTIERKKA